VDRALVSAGTLYVVATPLGNLGDLSERAASVLRSVSVVAAEDTRRARVLLQRVEAKPRVVSYHAHSPASRADMLLGSLADGATVALLADAGTPTVSDPGAALVQRAHEAGVPVVAVPGPSAVAAALSISGLPADRYTFLGFVPRKGKERRALLQHVATSLWTCVLFEAPGRLVGLLHDLARACGPDRRAAVARELTKVHEELKSGTLGDLEVYYEESAPRGEVTLLVAGTPAVTPAPDESTVRARAEELLAEGMTRRDTAARLAAELAVSRREAYRIVTEL
jgi:16S rRNA (cytidine1402-2'-O)-methyltransferase